MLTKRQQQAITQAHKTRANEAVLLACVGGFWNGRSAQDFGFLTVSTLMSAGLMGRCLPNWHDLYLTPTGERLATILAELPAPLTRRQWQILLRFRDVGSDSSSKYTSTFRAGNGMWQLPCTESEWHTWNQSLPDTNERTMRTLCDYGLIGFEYIPFSSTPYAHLTPLGEELVSLLP